MTPKLRVVPADEKLRQTTFEDLARVRAKELTRAFDPDVLTVALNFVRIFNLLVNDLESRVHRPSGWTWAGFRVMFVVFVCKRAEPHEVARLAGVSPASVSGVLNTLERAGLIIRERISADRRIVTVRLTERGRRATVDAFKKNHEIEKAWLATLSQAEVRLLVSLLHRLHSPFGSRSSTGEAVSARRKRAVARGSAAQGPGP